jgi:hypothetical protein
MMQVCSKTIGLGACTLAFLMTAAFSAQGPGQRPGHCKPSQGLESAADDGDLRCLSQAKRVELLSQPIEQAVLAPLDRDYHRHSALHHLKAQEAEALATADPQAGHPLDAYLGGRAVESMRSQALSDAVWAISRSETRILLLGVDLKASTRRATDWIRRQPGRDLPAAYRQRILNAAEAILSEYSRLELRSAERDEINQVFDHALQRVLTQQG